MKGVVKRNGRNKMEPAYKGLGYDSIKQTEQTADA